MRARRAYHALRRRKPPWHEAALGRSRRYHGGMTYCVGIKLDAGVVFLSDSRTNAGVDQVRTFRKAHRFERPGDRIIVVQTAGNLVLSQACCRRCARRFSPSRAASPYFQLGESKYGKPILDRVVTTNLSLHESAKCALVSMDSTMKSNLSVGLPLDLV